MKEIQGKSILVRVIGSQRIVKYFHSIIQYFTFAVVNGWQQRKLNSGDCTFKRFCQSFQDKSFCFRKFIFITDQAMIKEKGVHVNFDSFNFRILWTRNVEVTKRVCECGIKFHAEKVLSHTVGESWYNHVMIPQGGWKLIQSRSHSQSQIYIV